MRPYIIQIHTGIATPNDTPLENLTVDDSILNSTPLHSYTWGAHRGGLFQLPAALTIRQVYARRDPIVSAYLGIGGTCRRRLFQLCSDVPRVGTLQHLRCEDAD